MEENSIPIKRAGDDKLIANAYVTPEQVSIILDDEIEISDDTPPFKSFFLDRIIGEMKKKDFIEVENGKIQKESIIDYIINKNGTDIREIILIRNLLLPNGNSYEYLLIPFQYLKFSIHFWPKRSFRRILEWNCSIFF